MSYTRPLTPRFYCDWVNWLLAEGKMATSDITDNLPNGNVSIATRSSLIEMFDMTPSNLQTITADTESDQIQIQVNTTIATDASQESSFVAIYGHNFQDANIKFKFQHSDTSGFTDGNVVNPALTEIVNLNSGNVAADATANATAGNYATPANNGWTLFSFASTEKNQYVRITIDADGTYSDDIQIGYISIGKYIDLPNAPDINIKRDFNEGEGNIINQTDGGMDFSNLKYLSAPNWYLAPYELKSGSTADSIRRSGRLAWDLNFSFVADTNFTPENWSSSKILQSDTIRNILQYTIGSHLPFLYQWDNSVSTEWDFCLSRVYHKPEIMKTNNVWSIGMQIVERY